MANRTIDVLKRDQRIGEIKVMNNGILAKIIKYRNASDIDIIFLDDNYLREHVRYSHFLEGKVDKIICRVGEVHKLKCGATAKIIKYKSSIDVDVEILENKETINNLQYANIKSGSVRPRYYPSVYGIGYLGESSIYTNGKVNLSYSKWKAMIERCYLGRDKAYKNVEVCEEWHNYSNFKKWFDENYYEVEDEQMDLDKDILSKGDKIYSPSTCLILPHYLNVVILNNKHNESIYGTGVSKKGKKYTARLSKEGLRVSLGLFDNIDIASNTYIKSKKEYINQVAHRYKDKIPLNVYNSIIDYKN